MSNTRKKVAINGTGRIGLCTARLLSQSDKLQLVALNTTMDIETLLHLIKYDSIHGQTKAHKIDDAHISINDSEPIKIYSNRDINSLNFSDSGATCVIECTGAFNDLQKAKAHIKGNIQKVVISAPATDTPTFVYGVNHQNYKGEAIISNASCTTNCLAPIAKILDNNYEIVNGMMTTIHSYTNDQNLLDGKHKKDLRRARAAALNMIPTSTGAAKAIGLVLPKLAGKLNGIAIRVPTANVSLVDLVANTKKPASKEEINKILKTASLEQMKGIMFVDDEKLVSSDFVGSNYSSIVASDQTMVIEGNTVKILAWYDNEAGYCSRLIDMTDYVMDFVC